MSGFLALAPRLGLVLSLLCATVAIAFLAGRLRRSFLNRGVALWLLATGVFGLLTTSAALAKEMDDEHKREVAAKQSAAAARADAQEADAVRAAAADILAEGRAAVGHARTVLAAGRYEEVEALLSPASAPLDKLAALVPPVEGAVALRDEVHAVIADARGFVSAKEACAAALEHAQTYRADVVAYDEQLKADAALLLAISGAPLRKYEQDVRRAQAAVEKQRKAIARKVERAKADARRADAVRVACGDKPLLNPWDGELAGAELFLQQGAHDPESIDVEACTDPVLTQDSCWVSTCNVRGKNAFGAMVQNRMRFSVGRDGILSAR